MTEFQMSVGELYTSAIFPTLFPCFFTVLLSLFTCIVIIVKYSIFLFPFPSLLTHPLSFLSLPLPPSPSPYLPLLPSLTPFLPLLPLQVPLAFSDALASLPVTMYCEWWQWTQ